MPISGGSTISPRIIWAFRGRHLCFYDDFNRTAEDTDVWTSGGDAGSFTRVTDLSEPTKWRLATGNTIDDDRYIHGDAVPGNKEFSIFEDGYTTVTWEARLSFTSVVDISALWGLFLNPVVDYAEPATRCAHFFADPAITNTFRARSLEAAEEETDTLVALDTDYHKFKMVWTATSVLFYIDDVLVATHATQVPDAGMITELLIRTEAVAFKNMNIDYNRVEVS
ncbi:unnamed protein product [marine sediment metagenome]|uniref:GH16 domain-containing protein n=1 Tax=marine sediment metagenome TaxID=412755 RepID=X1LTP4_9ZZZZ